MAYVPHGGEFRVNTQTNGNQSTPSIAVLDDGSRVIVWFDELGDGSGSGIKGQRYDASGAPLGGEFLVNTQTTGNQTRPTVTAVNGGGFVVGWTDGSGVSDGSFSSVNAQVFNAAGGRVGGELLVNIRTLSTQAIYDIARLSSGGFVITWTDVGGGNKARIYDAGGTPVSGEVVIDASASFDVALVTNLSGGRFVVVWDSAAALGADNSGRSVKAQIFDAGGSTIGGQFLVNTATAGDQQIGGVATLANGGFVVTWTDSGSGGNIKAQMFDDAGARVGGELSVNTTVGSQVGSTVGALSDGGFLVSWNDGTIFSNNKVSAQVFDLTGARVGSEFRVNTQTAAGQQGPSVAGLKNGGFTVAWTDLNGSSDGSGFSVKAQSYDLVPTGTPGDDNVTAPLGNARIDGLGGIDTVTFGFRLVDAHVSYVGNTVVIDGPSSHTVLSGFEKYVFTDGTVDNNDGDVLVDDLFYYSHNHDVWNAQTDADAHYHSVGWKEGRDPDAFFSTTLYRALYADVKAANTDPLRHFDQSGWKEGRLPSADFDPAAYLAANPDVKAGGGDPLAHFLAHGAEEGRQPFAAKHPIGPAGFDYVYYLQTNPDVAAAGADPLQHFNQFGWKEGRNPSAYFDTKGYLDTYADVKAAGVNPLGHYNQFGWHEGRDPSVGFDTTSYLSSYPDVNAANVNPLVHFLQFGIHEGRSSFSDGVWG